MKHFDVMPIMANPQIIHILDKDLVQKSLPLAKAEKLFKLKWLEWDIHNTKVIYPEKDFVNPASYSTAIIDKLLIRYMDPKCKWGLFAKNYIAKGTIISVFTGLIRLQDKTKSITGESTFISATTNDQYLIIDGTRHGNMTRFMQHLPKQEQITNYQFNRDINPLEVAVENVTLAVISTLSGFQTGIFIAKEDIPPHTIIGCAYYDSFWQQRQPIFFKKNGEIIV